MADPELISFPDVEALICDYLAPLVNVPVSTGILNPRPDSFVRVTRVGGPRRSIITDAATVTVDSWALDEVAASALARLVRAHMGVMPGKYANTTVYTVVEYAGPANLPDPDSNSARYTQTFEVLVRGSAA